jgi:hypothetical protein
MTSISGIQITKERDHRKLQVERSLMLMDLQNQQCNFHQNSNDIHHRD